MSLVPLIPSGQYRIFSAKFPTQDADLLGGGATATIGGYVNNSNTFNMVWNLMNVADTVDQFTLTNAAPSANGAYAFNDNTEVGAGLHGSTNAAVWTIVQTTQPFEYLILAPAAVSSSLDSALAWSLDSDEDRALITLAQIDIGDLSQVWTFQPQTGNVGYTGKGEDGLD